MVVGGPRGDFDLPIARPFVQVLAPRRGEIVADPEALDLPASADIRPRRRRARPARAGRRAAARGPTRRPLRRRPRRARPGRPRTTGGDQASGADGGEPVPEAAGADLPPEA